MEENNPNNLNIDEPPIDQQTQPIDSPSPELKVDNKPRFNKKVLIIACSVLVILLVVGGYLLLKKDNKPADNPSTTTNNNQQNTPSQPEAEAPKSILPENIIYGFAESDTKPYSLFWRSSDGGDRTASQTLGRNVYIGFSDVRANKIVFVSSPADGATDDPSIWYSEDSGKSYKKIFSVGKSSATGGNQITSLKISQDGSTVVIGHLPESGNSIAKEIDPKTLKVKNLFNGNKRGLFINAYDSKAQRIVYSEGCFQCDSIVGETVILRDLTKNTTKDLVKSTSTLSERVVAANGDFSEVLVVASTIDPTKETLMGSAYVGSPYKLIAVSLVDYSEKTLASYGPKVSDPNVTGVYSSAGYMNDGKTPYYAIDKQVYSVSSNKPTLLYEASKGLYGVYFVSNETVISGYGTASDFVLDNFSIKDKKITKILNGDNQTVILGVSLKN